MNLRKVAAFFIVGFGLTFIASPARSLGNPPSWREETANGRYPYHRLIAADFPINDTAYPEFGMHTHGFFQFHYQERWTENSGHSVARVTAWNVWSGFDRNKSSRKSWFKQVQETLPHEQGHLDINELCSRRLSETPLEKLPIGEGSTGKEAEADLKRKMNALSDRFSVEEKVEQERYDAETNHGRNSAKQKEWTASIQARLQRAGIHL